MLPGWTRPRPITSVGRFPRARRILITTSEKRSRRAVIQRTVSVFMTCTGMYTSGSRTAGMMITVGRHRMGVCGSLVNVKYACRAAVPGSTGRRTCAPRSAAGMLPGSTTRTTTGSVLPGRSSHESSSPDLRGPGTSPLAVPHDGPCGSYRRAPGLMPHRTGPGRRTRRSNRTTGSCCG